MKRFSLTILLAFAVLSGAGLQAYAQNYRPQCDDSGKYGFIPNLSIMDLLFNEGPDSISYLLR